MQNIVQKFRELVSRILRNEQYDDPEITDVDDAADYGEVGYDPHR